MVAIGATAAIMGGLFVGSAATANATPSVVCGLPHTVCWWTGVNYGPGEGVSDPVPSGTCLAFPPPPSNDTPAISASNNSDAPQRFWANSDCTGQQLLVQPYQDIPDLQFSAYSLGGYGKPTEPIVIR